MVGERGIRFQQQVIQSLRCLGDVLFYITRDSACFKPIPKTVLPEALHSAVQSLL